MVYKVRVATEEDKRAEQDISTLSWLCHLSCWRYGYPNSPQLQTKKKWHGTFLFSIFFWNHVPESFWKFGNILHFCWLNFVLIFDQDLIEELNCRTSWVSYVVPMCCIDCWICHFPSCSLIIFYHQYRAQFFSVVYFEGKIVSQYSLRQTMFWSCWYFHPMIVSHNEEASLFLFHCSVLLCYLSCIPLSYTFHFICCVHHHDFR